MRFFILLTLTMIPVSVLKAGEPIRLRVLSYNIHHGEGTDGTLDLKRIAKVINDAKPDLVALQEVDIKTARTGRIDEGAKLAQLTGLTFVPGDNIDYQGGRYGNGALVRGTVIRYKNHLLPPSTAEQRGVLEIVFQKNSESPKMRFWATHFDHRRDDRERLASVKFLNQLIVKNTSQEDAMPAILAGDLNDTPESQPITLLTTHWTNPTKGMGLLTSPAGHPVRQIDYILCRPGSQWTCIKAKVLDVPVASDHRPILVVLEWHGSE